MLAARTAEMDAFQPTLKLAFAEHNAGRHAEAETLCRSLMPAHPHDAQLLFLLGMILHKTGREAEAVTHLRAAAKLQPDSARIFSGLGYACQNLGELSEAVKCFSRASELEPQNANHFYSLGNVLHRLGELESAAAAFEKAVAAAPLDAECWNNLGKTFRQLNRLEESIAAYARAVEIAPDYKMARQGWSHSLLAAGRLAEGFRQYQSRERVFSEPLWNGDAIPGKTLFIYAEQGFGDAIHFARFLPFVRAKAGRVILECRPELKSLFAAAGCAEEIIAFGEPIPPFDFYTSVMRLPGALGITLENIPHNVPYLKAPADMILPGAESRQDRR